jgi:type IV secretory pathway VirB10-like protein
LAIACVGACVGLVSLTGAAACAKKPVVVHADPPPLEVPIVPPRVLGPVMVEEPPPPAVEAPEPAPARPGRGTRNTGRTNDPVVKVEPPPDSASKPPETSTEPAPGTSASAPAEPAPLLRTDTADDAEVARKVRETLGRANENLNKANYNNLSAGAKSQYDTARRFIAQAEEALKGRSLTFARYLADKAETLSASLLNR